MIIKSDRLLAHEASEIFVESKIQYLVDIHVWPERQHLDPRGWLRNFDRPKEQPFALNMLNVFIYYNKSIVNALFLGAVQQLSATVTESTRSFDEAQKEWSSFLKTTLITYVEGETPNPTDSGFTFARKARQILGISEHQIKHPVDALRVLSMNDTSSIVFVDDFVGSGEQMIKSWHRSYCVGSGNIESFALASKHGAKIFYTPIVATKYGLQRIREKCTGLDLRPAHIIDEMYSLTSDKSILWPAALKPHAADFLLNASRRAGIVDGLDGLSWKGFHDLALPLAFSHSVPDATLPLYFWDRNGWTPLITRS